VSGPSATRFVSQDRLSAKARTHDGVTQLLPTRKHAARWQSPVWRELDRARERRLCRKPERRDRQAATRGDRWCRDRGRRSHSVESDRTRIRERYDTPHLRHVPGGAFCFAVINRVRSVECAATYSRTVPSPQGALRTRIRCLTSDGLGKSGQWSAVGRGDVALQQEERDSHCWARDSASSRRRRIP
jgi:hypothetical protein